jgi:biotin synthase-like enzyme
VVFVLLISVEQIILILYKEKYMLNTNVNITALSVMTSCGCNLNCSYCRIAQSVHEKSVEIQKNTI